MRLFIIFVVCILIFNIFKPATSTSFPLKTHPLPPSLASWQDLNAGDYFEKITIPSVGSLIWSNFPIKVYLDRPPNPSDSSASTRRFQQWTSSVVQAIQDWNPYLPLTEVPQPESADIIIRRSPPPLKPTFNPLSRQLEIPRAATAVTNYQVYLSSDNPPILKHRMTINIAPGGAPQSLLSTARHELGHALGLWGHSPSPKDVMYFSQVRDSPNISPQDLNTLKKVYLQPTRLGWSPNY